MNTESNIKIPCPSCVFRGPVWLDENYKCVYCETTYEPGPDNYQWIWRVVPVEWWLEEGMINEAQIPEAVRVEAAEEAAKDEYLSIGF